MRIFVVPIIHKNEITRLKLVLGNTTCHCYLQAFPSELLKNRWERPWEKYFDLTLSSMHSGTTSIALSDEQMKEVSFAWNWMFMKHFKCPRKIWLLLYRRSFQAWRDRSRIFIAAREGRPMELRVRLEWGKFAGGLTLRGDCDRKLMTPLEAARKQKHIECIEDLVAASHDLAVLNKERSVPWDRWRSHKIRWISN